MSDPKVLQREIELWYSPDWCDWRWRVTGCKDSNVWTGFYIFHTIWAYFAALLGIWAFYKKIYQKVWRNKLRVFDFVDGGLRPRAAESFILFGTLHILGRAIYTSVILGTGFGSYAAAEFFHEMPWVILYMAGVSFTVGVIYATPRHRFRQATMEAVRLPSYTALNLILIVFCVVPLFTLPIFAALDGHARDTHRPDLAAKFNSVHYGLWSSYCWSLGAVTLYFGIVLVRILRQTMRDMSSVNGQGVSSTDSGTSGEFKRAIITLIITVACILVIEIAFALVLLFYAIFRTQIQSIRGVSIWIGFIWIFVTPAMLTPIFCVMLWGLYKNKEEERERTRSANSNPGASSTGPGRPSQPHRVPTISKAAGINHMDMRPSVTHPMTEKSSVMGNPHTALP